MPIYTQVTLFMPDSIEKKEVIQIGDNKIELSDLQDAWLMAHGGRTVGDVQWSQNKPYVFMRLARGGVEKVFIPEDEEIKEYLNS